MELNRINIASSLNAKGIITSSDTKLSGVPEQIAKLPTLSGDLTINPPNVGAMIDTKDREYDVTKINTTLNYPDSPNPLINTWNYFPHSDWVRGVAVDKYSNVYSCGDDKNVVKLNSDGSTQWKFIPRDALALFAIAIDNNSEFIYTCGKSKHINKITPEGKNVWSFTGHTDSVRDVVVGLDDYIYSCSNDKTVRKISSDNSEIWSFSDNASSMTCVAVDKDSNVYSIGTERKLKKISSDGALIWSKPYHTDIVSDLQVDDDGFVYTCSSDKTIKKISPDGDLVWSHLGSAYSNFGTISIDKYGFVYGGCLGVDNKIRKVSPDGDLVWEVNGVNMSILSMVVDTNQFLYFASSNYGVYKRFDNYSKIIEMDLKRR